jgi:hypothetical protein
MASHIVCECVDLAGFRFHCLGSAQNGNSEVPVHLLKAKQAYTARKKIYKKIN